MRTRHFEEIAEGGYDHIRDPREGNGIVYVGRIGDAHGTARPGEHLYGRRQELSYAEPVYGVGMGPAELHDLD